MKLTFVCSPYRGFDEQERQRTIQCCRQLAEMGYTPIAPHLYLSHIYDYTIPDQKAQAAQVSLELLRRSCAVVICDIAHAHVSDEMQAEIKLARSLGKYRTTLSGLVSAHSIGQYPRW